jgi:hypothetical protein
MNRLPRTGVKRVQGRVFSVGEALSGKVPYAIAPGQTPEDFPGWPAGFGWKLKPPTRWPDPGSLLRCPQTVWLVNAINPPDDDEIEFLDVAWTEETESWEKWDDADGKTIPGDTMHYAGTTVKKDGGPSNKVPNHAKTLKADIGAAFAAAAARIEALRPRRTYVQVIDYDFRKSQISIAGYPQVNGLFPACLPPDCWGGTIADKYVTLPFFGLSVDRTWDGDADADSDRDGIGSALAMIQKLVPRDFPAAFPLYGWSMHPTGIEWPKNQIYYGPVTMRIHEAYWTGQDPPYDVGWRWQTQAKEGFPRTDDQEGGLKSDEDYTRLQLGMTADWGASFGFRLGDPATRLDAGSIVRIVAEALRFDPATGKDLPP